MFPADALKEAGRVVPRPGRMVAFHHKLIHAGEEVGEGAVKYVLRADAMYRQSAAP